MKNFKEFLNENAFTGVDGLWFSWENSLTFEGELDEKELTREIEIATKEKVKDFSIISDKKVQIVLSNSEKIELEFEEIQNYKNNKKPIFYSLININ